jgi:ABC-type nitrate/sulfonate/bicarbonate transport system permease component
MKLRHLASYGPAFVLIVALLALWELYVRSGQIALTILPTPSAVVLALFENWDVIYPHMIQTMMETVLGLLIATLLGLLLAILLDLSLWARRAVYPVLITSQTIPMIALAPLLLIWFGYDLGPKVIIVRK